MSACLFDQVHDPLAAFAAVHGAAVIDRVAQDRDVLRPQFAGEGFGEFVAHLAQRAITMRLEKRDDAALARFQRAQRGGAFFGIVAEIVDHGDARRRGADHVEAPGKALELRQRCDRIGHRDIGGIGRGNGGQRVRKIVPPGHGEAQRVLAAVAAVDHRGALRGRRHRMAALRDAECRTAVVDPEGERRIGLRHEAESLFIVGIHHPARSLGEEVAEQVAQFFHALVIEADVQQHGDVGPVEGDGPVAFVHFADIGIAAADDGAGEGAVVAAKVLHHRAVHDRRLAPGVMHDPAKHSGDGGLAAGARDPDARARVIEQHRVQLGAGHARTA